MPLRLVEEAPLEHPRPVLSRELDVARREEEDLVGDPLHPAVEGVREAAREVDQPLRQMTDVPALVRIGDLVFGEVAVLVPVLFLGNAEVDEGTGPDVGESHRAADVSAARGPRRPARRSPPPRWRPGNPGSFPSTAQAARA